MVNNRKLGRVCLLPKIYKRLNSVPGRPIISNSGFHTENFWGFWIFIYKPWRQVSAPISRTQVISRKRYKSLGNLSEDAILCKIDVVALYHSTMRDWECSEGLLILPGVSKRPAFGKILIPEYQSNLMENCLILSLIYQIRFSNLPGFNRPFLPSK